MKNNALTGRGLALALLAFVLVAAIVIVVSRSGHKPAEEKQNVPLPDITHQPLHLRVVQALNPRFAAMNGEQIQRTLDHTTIMLKQYFGLDVVFEFQGTITVEQLFGYLPEHIVRLRQSAILDPRRITKYDRMQLNRALTAQLTMHEQDTQSVMNYARPYLIDGAPVNDLPTLNHALINTLITRMNYWHEEKASDGNPYVDGSRYNQWVWWDSLGYGELPYDVVLTNQLVASIETYDLDVHSSLRGGINGGTTTYSKQGRYGGYVFVSMFAMLNDSAMLGILRDDAQYSSAQVENYTAATLVHELGHLFFHYGHPFGMTGCVMNPTPLLRYREWYDGLKADACDRTHPQMQPGAAQIVFYPDW
jgi:hypothetical protein